MRQADDGDGQRQPCALCYAKNFRRGQRVADHALNNGARQAEGAAGHDCDQTAWQTVIPDLEILAVVGDQVIKHCTGRQPDGARAEAQQHGQCQQQNQQQQPLAGLVHSARLARNRKNGAPINAVTTPAGVSTGNATARLIRSEASTIAAPSPALIGINQR